MVSMGNTGHRNTQSHWVELGGLTLYFSYRTVVAFRTSETGLVVSENVWSTTTGRHLNEIDDGDKKSRLPHAEFEQRLNEVLARHNL